MHACMAYIDVAIYYICSRAMRPVGGGQFRQNSFAKIGPPQKVTYSCACTAAWMEL